MIKSITSGNYMKIGEKNVRVRDKNTWMLFGSVLIIGSILGLIGSPRR